MMHKTTATGWKKSCMDLLQFLNKSEDSVPFRTPVNIIDAPDYINFVTFPMDLKTVGGKLKEDIYSNTSEFLKDVRCIFENSRKYYRDETTAIFTNTVRLAMLFEDEIGKRFPPKTDANNKITNGNLKMVFNRLSVNSEEWKVGNYQFLLSWSM